MNAPSASQGALLISEDAVVRNAVRTLLAGLGCECVAVSTMGEGLARVLERSFGAVLLHRECDSPAAEGLVAAIEEIRPDLLERILILSEDGDEATALVGSLSLPTLPRDRLPQQLWPTLLALFQQSPLLEPVGHKARLVLDTSHQPVAVGLRGTHESTRTLLYEQGTVTIDLQVASEPGSDRVWLAGQVMDSARPDPKLNDVPISVAGFPPSATTNQFGEFFLEFRREKNTELRIGIRKRHAILIPLKDLEPANCAAGSQPTDEARAQ